MVAFGEIFQLFLRSWRAWQGNDIGGEFYFAAFDVLLDDADIFRFGIQAQIFLIMINRRCRIGRFSIGIEETGELKIGTISDAVPAELGCR